MPASSLESPKALEGSASSGGLQTTTKSMATSDVCVEEKALPTPYRVNWQWEHRTGFRDYKPDQNAKIEFAYQRGDAKVRLKTGKEGCTPMEIFFTDMLQLDTMSGNQRRVQRVGNNSFFMRMRRFMKEFIRSAETGQPRRQTLAKYQSRQEALVNSTMHVDVTDLYNMSSCWSTIASSTWFSFITYTVVFANVVWIGIDVDWNPGSNIQDSPWVFRTMEYMFCAAFSVELIIRFLAFRRKRDFILDGWFCFDSVLVLLMLLELCLLPLLELILGDMGRAGIFKNVTILRMARLLKLTRMTRLLRALPELMTMLRGIAAALRSVIFTLLLQLLLLYVFGIIFCTWTKGHGLTLLHPYFETLGLSMYSLLVYGTLLDGPSGPLNDMLSAPTPTLVALFLVFIVLSSLTVLNMLVGLLFQVVADVHEAEKRKNEWDYLRYSLLDILDCYDRDGDRTLGKDEFKVFVKNPEVHDVLRKFGTDLDDMVIMADVLFDDVTEHSRAGKLTFEELLQVINRLRGARSASVTDIVELRQYLRQCIELVETDLRKGQREMLSHLAPQSVEEDGTTTAGDSVPSAPHTPGSAVVLRLELDGRARSQMRRRSTMVGKLLSESQPRHGKLVAKDSTGLEIGPEITLGELIDPGTGEVNLRFAPEDET